MRYTFLREARAHSWMAGKKSSAEYNVISIQYQPILPTNIISSNFDQHDHEMRYTNRYDKILTDVERRENSFHVPYPCPYSTRKKKNLSSNLYEFSCIIPVTDTCHDKSKNNPVTTIPMILMINEPESTVPRNTKQCPA